MIQSCRDCREAFPSLCEVHSRTAEQRRAMATKRIYEDPNHPHYGPVRRLWIMLAGLDMLDFAERYRDTAGYSWDESVSLMLAVPGYTEAQILRNQLEVLLFNYFKKD